MVAEKPRSKGSHDRTNPRNIAKEQRRQSPGAAISAFGSNRFWESEVGRSDSAMTVTRLADVEMLAVAKPRFPPQWRLLAPCPPFKSPYSFEIPILKETWQTLQNNMAELQRSERLSPDNQRKSPSAPSVRELRGGTPRSRSHTWPHFLPRTPKSWSPWTANAGN